MRSSNLALAGQRAFIVGGTSGIGLAVAVQSQKAGAEVVVTCSYRVRAERVAAKHGLLGWRAMGVVVPDAIAA